MKNRQIFILMLGKNLLIFCQSKLELLSAVWIDGLTNWQTNYSIP